MSIPNNPKQPDTAAGQSGQPYFPPPPGPPPGIASQQAHEARHSNEAPIPDYAIPRYDPAHPHFAPSPNPAAEDDIYNAPPPDEHPPPFPPRPTSSGKHH